MAVNLIFPVLLVTVIAGCTCEPINGYSNNNGYNNGNGLTHFNDLKPPPPPLLPVIPVPFHRGIQLGNGIGGSISQRQNFDTGYHYQPPATQYPPAVPIANVNDFKFPAPFYKQYNFNFVPPPQPFTTTPSPSMFQKVSNWLFPSQEQTYDTQSEVISNYNAATFKKDCNPCNLVPWIPVIRYDLAAKSQRNVNPTYGPPSPTASSDAFNSAHNLPQPFSNQNFEQKGNNVIKNNQHSIYGPPNLSHVASTYGPPSPTHIVDVSHQRPLTSPFAISSNSFASLPYNIQTTTVKPVIFNQPVSLSYGQPSSYGLPSSTISTPFSQHDNIFLTTTSLPFLTQRPEIFNQQLPHQNDVEIISQNKPSQELQLPKVTRPTGFRNSYGELIDNAYGFNLPYQATATGAESSKVKTEVLPDNSITTQYVDNMSLALANPAPFTINRGRNIHTLQPVALPNLSISPLPPIFNARPFRPVTPKYFGNILYGSNQNQTDSNNLNVAQSVPLAEYTHSIEYPATFIQSPLIDIDAIKSSDNQTKGYRNIQNSFVIDEVRDISPQASDNHISATKTNPESSFESTGPDLGNDLYEGSMQSEFSPNKYIPPNHRPAFADLRGVKDEDVDKYRTESNLQHIDSPLLYLKPSAPHKNYENFFSSTSEKNREYEIYDESPTTPTPVQSTPNIWDSSRTYFMEESSVPATQESTNQAKIVQIIVPYTITHKEFIDDNTFETQQDFQGRKVHTENKINFVTIPTETYSRTTTEQPISTISDQHNSEILNTPAILNDLYDVKEPPFDIIKLQHTIDDWTEQEYSNVNEAQKVRSSEKYAKQIPDNYFTTMTPVTTYATEISNYNYDTYDHEFSSSNQYVVTDNKTNIFLKANKGYNDIEKTKVNYISAKNEEEDERLHIYTAASTFRTTTTTPAPWGSIQTSISPLTNEKVYVVTSKPWREKQNNLSNRTQEFDSFESKKTSAHSYVSSGEVVLKPSKSFHQLSSGSFHRTSKGFRIGEGRLNGTKFDSSYTYSNGWHRRINNLGDDMHNEYVEDSEDTVISQENVTNKTDTTN